jgi:predicted methyltransferase
MTGFVGKTLGLACALLGVGVLGTRPRMALAVEPVIALTLPGAPAATFPAPDRPVASIISPICACEDERRSADGTGQIFSLLGVKPGMRVADVGAGYCTVRWARAVGRRGEVFAQDLTPAYLTTLKKGRRCSRRRLRRSRLCGRQRETRFVGPSYLKI